MSGHWAAPSSVDGTARALLDPIDLPGGIGRLERFMFDLVGRLAPDLVEEPLAAGFLADPRTFAAITSGAFHDLPAIERRGRRRSSPSDGIDLEPLDGTTVWPHLRGSCVEVDLEASALVPDSLRDGMGRALATLARSSPHLHDALLHVVRTAVTYSGDRPNSFATMRAHGAIFLNWREGDGYPYMLEEMVHQGGHVLLSTALFEREHEPFTIEPSTPLRQLGIDDNEDGRELIVLLHAVFTEALMLIALHEGACDQEASAAERHEIEGRMLLTARRFGSDLQDLYGTSFLSDLGAEVITRASAVFAALGVPILSTTALDLTGQPYAFCRTRFFQQNPADPTSETSFSDGQPRLQGAGAAPSPRR